MANKVEKKVANKKNTTSKTTKKTTPNNKKKQSQNQNEKQNNAILAALGIIIIVIVIITIFQLTYAFFNANVNDMNPDNTDVEVISADLEVTYHDGGSNIELGGKIVPGSVITKEFSVENTGNDTGMYTITLENFENHFNRERSAEETTTSDFTYNLYRIDSDNNESVISTGTLPLALTAVDITLYSKDEVLVKTTNKYKLEIIYQNLENIDQSDDMGKLLEAKINITEYDGEKRTKA